MGGWVDGRGDSHVRVHVQGRSGVQRRSGGLRMNLTGHGGENWETEAGGGGGREQEPYGWVDLPYMA